MKLNANIIEAIDEVNPYIWTFVYVYIYIHIT